MITITLTHEEALRVEYELAILIGHYTKSITHVMLWEDSPERAASIQHYTERCQFIEGIKNRVTACLHETDLTTTPPAATI